jgi:succinyl-CoA synthetase beta subunit
MARAKITEWKAKTLLMGDAYAGISVTKKAPRLRRGKYVVKVDQGVKQRFKKGLVVLNQDSSAVPRAIAALRKKGFTQFLVEPFFPHDQKDEQYLSFERVRGGIRILHAREGGVDIESHAGDISTYLVAEGAPLPSLPGIPQEALAGFLEVFEKEYFSFLEINPLVVTEGRAEALDAAVLVDSAAAFFPKGWTDADIVAGATPHNAEIKVAELSATSPASFKMTVLNPHGSLFFLLSGGGGSIVIADEAALQGYGKAIGNYGEYSGGPTREETYLYTKEVVGLLLASKAKQKALVIAGGVANFTDVHATFLGIVDALTEVAASLRKQRAKVFVRRGGPHEQEGLALMEAFLAREKLLGTVHGSDQLITAAVSDALAFLKV